MNSLVFQIAFFPRRHLTLRPYRYDGAVSVALFANRLAEDPPAYAEGSALRLLEELEGYEQGPLYMIVWKDAHLFWDVLTAAPLHLADAARPLRWRPGAQKPVFRSVDFENHVMVHAACEPLHTESLAEAQVFSLAGGQWLLAGDAMVQLDSQVPPELALMFPAPKGFADDGVETWCGTVYPALAKWTQVTVEDSHTQILLECEPEPVVHLALENHNLVVTPSFRYPPYPQRVAAADQRALIHDGRRVVRDRDRERGYVKQFDALLRTEQRGLDGRVWLDADRMVNFVETVLPQLQPAWALEQETGLLTARKPNPGKLEVRFSVATRASFFDLGLQIHAGGEWHDGWKALNNFRRGEKAVRTGDGSYVKLPTAEMQALWEKLAEFKGQIHRAKARDLALMLAPHGDTVSDDGWQAAVRDLDALTTREAIAPQRDLQATLRPYQIEGLSWVVWLARNRFGGVLADDMGLGKTLQTIAYFLHAKTDAALTPPSNSCNHLVVAPTSVIHNWERELARFAPSLSVCRWTDAGRITQLHRLREADVVLTSYAILRLDAALLADRTWRSVVVDEAQNIKNPNALVTEAARAVPAEFRLALSGTPIENHLGDLWSLFQFAMPQFLGSPAQFEAAYPDADQPGGRGRKRLRERIAPFLLRRTKEQVAPELPPKTETVITCELSDGQRAVYESIRAAAKRQVDALGEADFPRERMQVLTSLLRLRQICCDPALLPEDMRAEAGEGSPKMDAFLELIDEAVDEGHKVLVFSSFRKALDVLERPLRERKLDWARLDGATVDRPAQVSRFNEDPHCKVFLCTLKAGGVGLNLTAADYVVLYEPWWNPAAEAQAIDRAHRIGQDKPVFVYKLIAAQTIEEGMLALQRDKKALTEDLLDGDGGSSLSLADIRKLLA